MQYNGDGVLVAQTQAGVTTRYVQDLAAPLSQILNVQQGSSTTTAIYGMGAERLATVTGSTWHWPLVDALGTPKLTLDNSGAPLTNGQYDAWGVPSAGTVPHPFGFTGELHNANTGLVYLRARWYQPGDGTLLGRDPFAGYEQQPYSLHPYQYAYAQPTRYTDPSGLCPTGDQICQVVFNAVINQMKYTPEGLETWDTQMLLHLNTLLSKGIKFVPVPINCSDPRDTQEPPWSSTELAWLLDGFARLDLTLQQRFDGALGLTTHTTFTLARRQAGYPGGTGGQYFLAENSLSIYSHLQSDPERVIATLIHEVGHSVDYNAGQGSAWSKNSQEWLTAAGWVLGYNNWYMKTELKGKLGAVNLYAIEGDIDAPLNKPIEDFAETWTWYVQDQAGYPFDPRRTNRDNVLNGKPNPERIDAIKLAISLLP